MAKLALLCHFAGVSPSCSPEGLSEQKARNRVYATRKLSIPKDCILPITVFHVAMVLTKRRRERTGADTGGVDRVDIHPPFFSKKKIGNVTLFEIENKERKKN